jgi:hypothetical protein
MIIIIIANSVHSQTATLPFYTVGSLRSLRVTQHMDRMQKGPKLVLFVF